MQETERSAASVEEAIEAALAELGVSEQEAQIEIVQEPKSGFLGLNQHPAIVRVRVRGSAPVSEEASDEQAELGATFLEGLMDVIGMETDVEINDVDGVTYLDVWGADASEDMGLLIGKRGHTVEALQEVVRSYVQHASGERSLVQVDVEDYRKRRRSFLVRRARDAARRVRKTGKPEALEPMNAFERKIVHDAVSEVPGLETLSEGEDPARHVVIRRRRD